MRRELADPVGVTYLILAMLVAKMFTVFPRMLAVKIGQSAWIVVILAGVVALPGFWCISKLLRRFPGQSLGRISQDVLGRAAGRLFCLAYAAYFVYLSGLFMREFEASFRIAVLPRTPASALMTTFAISVAFVAFRGIEALSRIASYMMPAMLALLALTAIGTVRLIDLRQLTPLFGYGIRKTLLLSLPECSLYSELLALGALAGVVRSRDVHQIGIRSHVASIGLLAAIMVILGSAFPFPGLTRLHFPMLDLTRAIQVGEFLQRIETVFVMLWFFFGSFKVSLAIICAAIFFGDLVNLAEYRLLILPLMLIAYTIAFLPANSVVVSILDSYTLREWSWPVAFGLPAVTLAVAMWRGKRGAGANAAAT